MRTHTQWDIKTQTQSEKHTHARMSARAISVGLLQIIYLCYSSGSRNDNNGKSYTDHILDYHHLFDMSSCRMNFQYIVIVGCLLLLFLVGFFVWFCFLCVVVLFCFSSLCWVCVGGVVQQYYSNCVASGFFIISLLSFILSFMTRAESYWWWWWW